MKSADRYPLPIMVLHWLIAVLIAGLLALGYYMTDLPRNTPERAFYFNLHKSFGILTLVLFLARLGLRATLDVPPMPGLTPRWQVTASVLSHRLLYVCLVVQLATGYVGSSLSKFGIKFFGLQLPNWGWEDKALRELFFQFHEVASVVLITLIVVHVVAALKHLLVDKDGVFQRMLP